MPQCMAWHGECKCAFKWSSLGEYCLWEFQSAHSPYPVVSGNSQALNSPSLYILVPLQLSVLLTCNAVRTVCIQLHLLTWPEGSSQDTATNTELWARYSIGTGSMISPSYISMPYAYTTCVCSIAHTTFVYTIHLYFVYTTSVYSV